MSRGQYDAEYMRIYQSLRQPATAESVSALIASTGVPQEVGAAIWNEAGLYSAVFDIEHVSLALKLVTLYQQGLPATKKQLMLSGPASIVPPKFTKGQEPLPIAALPPKRHHDTIATAEFDTTGAGHEPVAAESAQHVGGWQDVPFAIAFAICLLGVFAVIGLRFEHSPLLGEDTTNATAESNDALEELPRSVMHRLVLVAAFACIGGILWAVAWMELARVHTKEVVYGSIFCFLGCLILLAMSYIAMGGLVYGVFMLLIAGLFCFAFYMWRDLIPFAIVIIHNTVTIIKKYRSALAIALASLVVEIVFTCVWLVALSCVQTSWPGLIFLLFAFFWTTQVIKNVVHVTVIGGVADWYFSAVPAATLEAHTEAGDIDVETEPVLVGPPSPMGKALRRALTTSFGAVCFGSLILALWKTFRAIVNLLFRDRQSFVGQCVDCFMGCIEAYMEVFTKFAFAQTAIYGKGFYRSAKDTWEMMSMSNVGCAIMNDNIVSCVMICGILLGTVLLGMMGAGWFLLTYGSEPSRFWITAGLLSMMVAFVTINTLMEVVSSGTVSIFVCFVMDAPALRITKPALYAELVRTFGQNPTSQ